MKEKFTFFWSGVFSQWQMSNFEVPFNNLNEYQEVFDNFLKTIDENSPLLSKISDSSIEFNCAEQFMMFMKALIFKDYNIAKEILLADHPKKQKKLGRKVSNYDDEIWKSVAKDVVYLGSYYKYTTNEYLMNKLLLTVGTTLVEASPVDRIWGIGLSSTDPRALNRETWNGTNWLGEVLTDLRDNFINYYYPDLNIKPIKNTVINICE